jgi:hypothetical protein
MYHTPGRITELTIQGCCEEPHILVGKGKVVSRCITQFYVGIGQKRPDRGKTKYKGLGLRQIWVDLTTMNSNS